MHPNKQASEEGFRPRERRRYPAPPPSVTTKIRNHKPELVFALTPFLAMNAFREFSEIVTLLQPVAGAHPAIGAFLQQPDATPEPAVCQPAKYAG
ncbi:hypothetical protein LNQ03_00640 [Klebsiella pneumoniae subsp. pneumoniae]|nr:hypothetical protein [Klebsiella pneumoniae subsp. pneumoniae]